MDDKYLPNEPPALQPGEPYFYLRAQDALAPSAVLSYAQLLRAAAAGATETNDSGQPGVNVLAVELRSQARQVEDIAARMIAWQAEHHVKLPD